jgi:hypothetical protein
MLTPGIEIGTFLICNICHSHCFRTTGLLGPKLAFKTRNIVTIRDFRLQPRSRWELRSSGLLVCGYWQFISEVSGQKNLDSWPLIMEPIGCPETSVRRYRYSMRNNPEERGSRNMLRAKSKLQLDLYIWCHIPKFFLICAYFNALKRKNVWSIPCS